jgi:hypothetical protein
MSSTKPGLLPEMRGGCSLRTYDDDSTLAAQNGGGKGRATYAQVVQPGEARSDGVVRDADTAVGMLGSLWQRMEQRQGHRSHWISPSRPLMLVTLTVILLSPRPCLAFVRY